MFKFLLPKLSDASCCYNTTSILSPNAPLIAKVDLVDGENRLSIIKPEWFLQETTQLYSSCNNCALPWVLKKLRREELRALSSPSFLETLVALLRPSVRQGHIYLQSSAKIAEDFSASAIVEMNGTSYSLSHTLTLEFGIVEWFWHSYLTSAFTDYWVKTVTLPLVISK